MSHAAHRIHPSKAPQCRPLTALFAAIWTAPIGIASAGASATDAPLPFKISAEARLRYEVRDALGGNGTTGRLLTRGVVATELRVAARIRAGAEIATGDVTAHRREAGPNLRNEVSLQQLWMEVPVSNASPGVVALLGRQEFEAAPRQLISVGDGPNLHRTWNGARLAWKEGGARFSAFAFRATQLGRHGFDERVSPTERLGGVTAGFAIPGARGAWSIDPFWLRTEKPGARRDTFGTRVSARRGGLVLDWTAAVQSGRLGNRAVAAWAVFASQSLELTPSGWRPRVSLRVDAASGEGGVRSRTAGRFDQLYASSSYLGEGLFLSASNLLLVSPGMSFVPTERTKVAVDYGFARRLDPHDAAFAGQMRAYPGTAAVPGRDIGGLLRVTLQWSAAPHVVIGLDYEHLSRGDVLVRAHLPARRYAHGSVSFRY